MPPTDSFLFLYVMQIIGSAQVPTRNVGTGMSLRGQHVPNLRNLPTADRAGKHAVRLMIFGA